MCGTDNVLDMKLFSIILVTLLLNSLRPIISMHILLFYSLDNFYGANKDHLLGLIFKQVIIICQALFSPLLK